MILIVDIKKRLGDFLLEVSFETEDRVTGLLGPSGCGKSMTLKCIAGVEKPDSGRIILDGETLFDSRRGICLSPQKRRVGYLFQSYALFPNMTAAQNILCGMRAGASEAEHSGADAESGMRQRSFSPGRLLNSHIQRKKEEQERLHKLSQLFHLEPCLHLHPRSLSGGQAQRTALARILAGRPRLLLLDEPFSTLDSYLKDQLQPEFKHRLSSLDCRTVMVTHSRDEAYHLCSRLCVMDSGRILRNGSVKEVFAEPEYEAAARLTGCKNIVPAVKEGPFLVRIPSWNITLQTERPVPDNLSFVGLRAHSFSPDISKNQFPIRLCDVVEEPFEWMVLFFYETQKRDSAPVWWRVPKEKISGDFPSRLGISPAQVLLLKSS